ncbi:MAG: hypothetical protein Kow0069_16860 [Promethearchaeota archaeon]
MTDVELDARGKKCPMPVLMTKKELRKMAAGQTLVVKVDDAGALKDIPALLSKTGDELLDTKQDGSEIVFHIRKA